MSKTIIDVKHFEFRWSRTLEIAVKAWVKKLNFTPPQLHSRHGACSWIVRGFCVMVSSVYLSKFKIIETCLFLALFCLCIFVILMALFKSHFLLILSFFNRKIWREYFLFLFRSLYCSIGILISSYFAFYFIARIVLAFIIRLRFKTVVFLSNLVLCTKHSALKH